MSVMKIEIKQIDLILSHLPHWVFDSEYFKDEIEYIWQNIRTTLIDLENQDIRANKLLFNYKEIEILTSKRYNIVDKQLSIIFNRSILV